MKKLSTIMTVVLTTTLLNGCVKVDNDTYAPNNSTTTNNYNGTGNNGTGTGNGNNGNTNSVLNVDVKFNGSIVGGMNLYEFRDQATLKFDWNMLPADCSQMQITIYVYDKANGANWTYLPSNGGKIQGNYNITNRTASLSLPLKDIPFNCEMVIGWHIVPICSSSNVAAVEGTFYAIRRY